MRIVIETEETAEHPAHPPDVEPGSMLTAEDAGASTAAADRAALPDGDRSTGEGDAQDAGSPPQWLVDQIARLSAESQAGDQTTGADDAGPGPSD